MIEFKNIIQHYTSNLQKLKFYNSTNAFLALRPMRARAHVYVSRGIAACASLPAGSRPRPDPPLSLSLSLSPHRNPLLLLPPTGFTRGEFISLRNNYTAPPVLQTTSRCDQEQRCPRAVLAGR